MDEFRDLQRLKQAFIDAHYEVHRSDRVTVYASERASTVSAFARASVQMPDAWGAGNTDRLLEEVARLIVAVAHAYDGGRKTAVLFAGNLLKKAGLQLPLDDADAVEANLDIVLQSKKVTDVVEVFRHWR